MAESLANLIYYRLAQSMYPDAKEIRVRHHYLHSNHISGVTYTLPILVDAKSRLENLLDLIDSGTAPATENDNCA